MNHKARYPILLEGPSKYMQPRRFIPSKSIPSGTIHFTVKLGDVLPGKRTRMQGDAQTYLPRPCTIHIVTFSKGLRDYHLPTVCTLNQSRVTVGQVKEWGPSGNPRIDPCPKNGQLTLEEETVYVAYMRCPVPSGRTRDPINPTFVGVMTLAEYNEAVNALPLRTPMKTGDGSANEITLTDDEQEAIKRIAQARKHDPRFQTPPRHGKLGKGMKIVDQQANPPGAPEQAA